MPDGLDFSLIGVDEILGKLEEVGNDVRFKGGRFALRKAANLVANKVKENARALDDPLTSEEIHKNVAVRWSRKFNKRTGNLKFRVGIRGGAGGNAPGSAFESLPGGDTRHWRFLEFGTEKAPARPFMRPALENNIGEATNEFIVNYGKAIDRAIRRAKKKAMP